MNTFCSGFSLGVSSLVADCKVNWDTLTAGFALLGGILLSNAQALAAGTADSVGLSLFFQNGTMAPITIVGDAPRYLQEIDITATVTTNTDQGIMPVIQSSEFSSLDWKGITLVEEDWRPAGDGTFTRQRFYRDAAWMEHDSNFLLFPTDSNGIQIGQPLLSHAGQDDSRQPSNDGAMRRFVARQIATGCRAVGDCAGATFTSQGLAQLRDALHPTERSGAIPAQATRLTLQWTEQAKTPRTVDIVHAPASAYPFGYGFQPSLEVISAPIRGFYVPGEQVSFHLTFLDGQGNRLHPKGSLPTFGQFLRGEIPSGLRYYDGFQISPTLYYALKHREANLLVTLSGPINMLRTPVTVINTAQALGAGPAVWTTAAIDGFSDVATGVPPFSIIFGGFANPAIWDTPVSDIVTFTIPADAMPGTYVVAMKARREFGGEALNRAATVTIQVGTTTPSLFTARTGNCTNCHTGQRDLGLILHGITDRRACFSCHASLDVEADNALDIRVHEVHDRSERFPADIRNCALCHLTPVSGPARGLLGN
jgi:hypothetical protein